MIPQIRKEKEKASVSSISGRDLKISHLYKCLPNQFEGWFLMKKFIRASKEKKLINMRVVCFPLCNDTTYYKWIALADCCGMINLI